MEGNQLLHPRHRVLLAAVLFALVASIIFLVVWKWPDFFRMDMEEPKTKEQIEYEARIQTLRELEQSSLRGGDTMSEAQKDAALNAVGASAEDEPDESGFTNQQKIDILNSLNAE
jgi:hypothetical protein